MCNLKSEIIWNIVPRHKGVPEKKHKRYERRYTLSESVCVCVCFNVFRNADLIPIT